MTKRSDLPNRTRRRLFRLCREETGNIENFLLARQGEMLGYQWNRQSMCPGPPKLVP